MTDSHRRTFLRSASAGAASALTAAAWQYTGQPAGNHQAEPGPTPRPNVIWILGDQFRAQALASNGDPNARTPNLDRAAVNGVTFANHLSGYPLCCPFRGSMLTSRYPHQCVPGHEYPLPEGQKTIADVFNTNGYHTAYFGKWHLGGFHESNGRAAFFITDPTRRGGFESWTGYENNNSQWDSWVHGGSGASAFHHRLPGYETDELTNLLIGYVKDRAAESRNAAAKPFSRC
jgi:arylsulfatase A-like enzyme